MAKVWCSLTLPAAKNVTSMVDFSTKNWYNVRDFEGKSKNPREAPPTATVTDTNTIVHRSLSSSMKHVVCYHVHKTPTLVHILNQINSNITHLHTRFQRKHSYLRDLKAHVFWLTVLCLFILYTVTRDSFASGLVGFVTHYYCTVIWALLINFQVQ